MVDGIYHSVQSRPKSKSKSSRLLFHLVSSSCSLLASMFRASSNSEGSEEQPSSSSWNPVSILAGGGSSSPSSASSMATWFSVEMCGRATALCQTCEIAHYSSIVSKMISKLDSHHFVKMCASPTQFC